jgi:hypothetical protein
MAMLIALLIGIPAGIISAVKKDTAWDYGANGFACGASVDAELLAGHHDDPAVLGELGWLPASGYVSPSRTSANLATMIMPAFVLGNAIAAVLMRHTRSAMLQVLSQPTTCAPRAPRASTSARGAEARAAQRADPVITLGALELGTLLSGAVLTEQVFTIPGFGKLIVDAVFNRDYAVVQGVVLVTARLHRAEPAGRRGVLPGQPAAAGLMPMPTAIAPPFRPRTPCREEARGARLAPPAQRGAARWSGWPSSCSSCCRRDLRALDRALRPHRHELGAVRKAPSAAHWFGTDEIGRDVLRGDLGRARVAAGRRGVGRHRARLVGVPIGLLAGYRRRLGRCGDLAHHRRDAGLPVPDPGDRAGGLPGAEPDQRDDRHRHVATPIFVRLTRGQVLA